MRKMFFFISVFSTWIPLRNEIWRGGFAALRLKTSRGQRLQMTRRGCRLEAGIRRRPLLLLLPREEMRLAAPPPSPPGKRAEDAEYEEGGEEAARPRSCKDLPGEQVVRLVAPLLLNLLDFGSLEGFHQQLAGLAPALWERMRPSHWLKVNYTPTNSNKKKAFSLVERLSTPTNSNNEEAF
jgi:hypothetical protein